ncbi:hypothetical protein PSP6_430020 [Paraburkholderia tropica]|nr:hypothetical protein PSP6_430020 [Paraburkholderia tropica]
MKRGTGAGTEAGNAACTESATEAVTDSGTDLRPGPRRAPQAGGIYNDGRLSRRVAPRAPHSSLFHARTAREPEPRTTRRRHAA